MKNKLLFTAILFVITTNTFSQVPNYVPTNGLVGYWPFNGNAIDESVNANDGTVNGATLTSDRNGAVDNAYSFDGVNDFISVAHSNSLTFNQNQLSISVWIYVIGWPPANTIEDYFITKQLNDGNNQIGFHFYIYDGGTITSSKSANFRYKNGPSSLQMNSSVQNLNSGQWYQLIMVHESNLDKLYFNGSLIGSSSSSDIGGNNTGNLFFGCFNNLTEFYNGKLDDIGIWNRALTQCEIQDLYNAQLNSVAVNAGLDQTICTGTSVTLSGSGANTYSWNNSVLDGVSFEPTASQDYIVSADSAGCLSTDTVSVTVNQTSMSSQTQTALDSLTLNGQTYTQSGTYTQVIPNAAGCDSTITLNLTLNFTGITELKDGIRIYPNPTFDNLTIERTSSLNSNYVLVDSQGRLVLQGELTETITHLSLGKLEYGNYILQLENQSVPIRIVKQ